MKKPAVRVFVSSTFADMKREREALNTLVFPKIKARCEEKGIGFFAVDLRWGITEDDVKNERVIDLCLSEIDGARPFFIGLVGNRYGWVPPRFSERTAERFPWLKNSAGSSVTEIEMCYGALECDGGDAMFYLKDESLFCAEEGDGNGEKLDALRARIAASGCYRMTYNSIDCFADDVLLRLMERIDGLYGGGENSDRLKQDNYLAGDIDSYVPDRLKADIIKQLVYDKSDNRPILIYSEKPVGKTIVLNNFVNAQPGKKIIINLAACPDIENEPRRLFSLLADGLCSCGVECPKFSDGDLFMCDRDIADCADMRGLIGSLKTDEPFFILINDVDRLRSNTAISLLQFIPTTLPDNVYVLLSTNNAEQRAVLSYLYINSYDISEAEQNIKDALNAGHSVEGISEHNGGDFFADYLALYGKHIDDRFGAAGELSVAQQRLIADYLVQFSSFESYFDDFNYLVHGKNGAGDIFDTLNNSLELIMRDLDEESVYYLAVLMVRIACSDGIPEDELFAHFPDEKDTVSMLALLDEPKFKTDISGITKSYVMRALSFYFSAVDGVVKNKSATITDFILKNVNTPAHFALAYKLKALKSNFAAPSVDMLNIGRAIYSADYERVFLTNSHINRIISFDLFDIPVVRARALVAHAASTLSIDSLFDETPINSRLFADVKGAIKLFTDREHPAHLEAILTDSLLSVFVFARDRKLFKSALYHYILYCFDYLEKHGGRNVENEKRFYVTHLSEKLFGSAGFADYADEVKSAVASAIIDVVRVFGREYLDLDALGKIYDDWSLPDKTVTLAFNGASETVINDYAEFADILNAYYAGKLAADGMFRRGEICTRALSGMESDNSYDRYLSYLIIAYASYMDGTAGRENVYGNAIIAALDTAQPYFVATAVKLYGLYLAGYDSDGALEYLLHSEYVFRANADYFEQYEVRSIIEQLKKQR